jgi:hypothetical protein
MRAKRNHVPWSAWVATVVVAVACGGGGDDGDFHGDVGTGGAAGCVSGAKGCPCDPNDTCDAGLICRAKTCVPATGDTGGASPTGGFAGNSAGSGGASGGGGGTDSGGKDGAGGTMTDTGGADGSGGSGKGGDGEGGACDADTQSDPENCGSCGRVCRNYADFGTCESCCVGGKCSDFFGDCLTYGSGFQTCTEYCASIGEQCVRGGCGSSTWRSWITPGDCAQFSPAAGDSQGLCDVPLDFGPSNTRSVRCCCSDQAP